MTCSHKKSHQNRVKPEGGGRALVLCPLGLPGSRRRAGALQGLAMSPCQAPLLRNSNATNWVCFTCHY